MTSPFSKTALRSPFLLPLCECSGPMNLASVEPHPTDSTQELKTYKCAVCSGTQAFSVPKRSAGTPATST